LLGIMTQPQLINILNRQIQEKSHLLTIGFELLGTIQAKNFPLSFQCFASLSC
jgi:hypothetical protein